MSKSFNSKRQMIETLILADEVLSGEFSFGEKFKCVIVGGSAFLLKYELGRVTLDIDIYSERLQKLEGAKRILNSFNINTQSMSVITLPHKFDEKAIKLNIETKCIDYYVLDDYALVISKLGSGRPLDNRDLLETSILDNVDFVFLGKLLEDTLIDNPVGAERIRNNFNYIKAEYVKKTF